MVGSNEVLIGPEMEQDKAEKLCRVASEGPPIESPSWTATGYLGRHVSSTSESFNELRMHPQAVLVHNGTRVYTYASLFHEASLPDHLRHPSFVCAFNSGLMA